MSLPSKTDRAQAWARIEKRYADMPKGSLKEKTMQVAFDKELERLSEITERARERRKSGAVVHRAPSRYAGTVGPERTMRPNIPPGYYEGGGEP